MIDLLNIVEGIECQDHRPGPLYVNIAEQIRGNRLLILITACVSSPLSDVMRRGGLRWVKDAPSSWEGLVVSSSGS